MNKEDWFLSEIILLFSKVTEKKTFICQWMHHFYTALKVGIVKINLAPKMINCKSDFFNLFRVLKSYFSIYFTTKGFIWIHKFYKPLTKHIFVTFLFIFCILKNKNDEKKTSSLKQNHPCLECCWVLLIFLEKMQNNLKSERAKQLLWLFLHQLLFLIFHAFYKTIWMVLQCLKVFKTQQMCKAEMKTENWMTLNVLNVRLVYLV